MNFLAAVRKIVCSHDEYWFISGGCGYCCADCGDLWGAPYVNNVQKAPPTVIDFPDDICTTCLGNCGQCGMTSTVGNVGMSMSAIAGVGGKVLWTHKTVDAIRSAHGWGIDPENLYNGGVE